MRIACGTATVGSSERVIASGMTMNAAVKKHMIVPTVRSARLRSSRAPAMSRFASACDICGKIAVATETAMSEYGSM